MVAPGGETEHVYYEGDEQDQLGQNDEIEISHRHRRDDDDVTILSEGSRNGSRGNSERCTSRERYSRHERQQSERRISEKRASERRINRIEEPRYSKRDSLDRRYPEKRSTGAGIKSRSPSTKQHKEEKQQHVDDAQNVGCTLYVRNLPTHFQNEHVRSYFNRHGEVVDCRIVINPVTKESRGFGFVTYRTIEMADHAMSQMDQTEVEGRILRVEKARRSKPHDPTPGEYKGPTGASIKYDNRGRLKPGYVPYWDLPPPRTIDHSRAFAGRHHHHDYHYHRSRSHPRQRRSLSSRNGRRMRSASSSRSRSYRNAGYYYSPPPPPAFRTSSKGDPSRYYYSEHHHHRHRTPPSSSSYRVNSPGRRSVIPAHHAWGSNGRHRYSSPNHEHVKHYNRSSSHRYRRCYGGDGYTVRSQEPAGYYYNRSSLNPSGRPSSGSDRHRRVSGRNNHSTTKRFDPPKSVAAYDSIVRH